MGKKSDSGEGDGNGNGDGEIPEPLVFVYYVTGHGLGHATRVVEVRRITQELIHPSDRTIKANHSETAHLSALVIAL
jgi:hypothetical protein